jgi:trehalose-phosphatase
MGRASRIAWPRYLFEDPEGSFLKKLESARRIALFLDFDGTLVPIRENPAECVLSKEMKKLLRSLAETERISLMVMSGRSLADVRKRVGIRNIYYGGNHGFDIAGPGVRYTHERALSAKPYVVLARDLLRRETANIEGVRVEDKRYSVSLHFRSVKKEDIRRVRKIFYDVAGELLENKILGLTKGKKVLELTPDPKWNKGAAVLWILHLFEGEWLPLYVGDDKTDETAFAALRKRGISVRVGKSKSTVAKYYLKGQSETQFLLTELLKYSGG